MAQGADASVSRIKKGTDHSEDDDEDDVNLAATFYAYLKYCMVNCDEDVVRSIYISLLFHSNYSKTCAGKREDEVVTMKSLFDACIQFEITSNLATSKKERKEKKKVQKQRVVKLYELAAGFYESSGSAWRKVVDGYQRELDSVKFS